MAGWGVGKRGVYLGRGPYPGISKLLVPKRGDPHSVEEDGPRNCRCGAPGPAVLCMRRMQTGVRISMLCTGGVKSNKNVFQNADLTVVLHELHLNPP